MKLKSFRTRVLLYFLFLLATAQILGFSSVYTALVRETRDRISQELVRDASAFEKLQQDRAQQLSIAGTTLSGDFAFKSLYANSKGDHSSILAALDNFRMRIGAEALMLVSTDYEIIADTLRPKLTRAPVDFEDLIYEAEENDSANSVVMIGDVAYQLVVVPLKAPTTVAWICPGFILDDELAHDFRKTARAEIAFIRFPKEGVPKVLASSSDVQLPDDLLRSLANAATTGKGMSLEKKINGEKHLLQLISLSDDVGVLLYRSLPQELEPFIAPLRTTIAALLLLSILAAGAGAVWVSGTVTHPVKTLVEGVRRITSGDYGHTVEIKQVDEIGELAKSFNDMTRGLEERDKVRDLLGKVVSPEIASELLKRKVQLSGEELNATILFSDIRGFTSMSEKLPPAEVLDILNKYLTIMSSVVENNGGIVDKYVGDAIMALFGVPVPHENDADRAITAALEMMDALSEINQFLTEKNMPAMRIGIGINTAVVVAGNVGSKSRFNYTVIGDGVNLAARLEQLTKSPEYGTSIIISENTLKSSTGNFNTRHLGEVNIRGKENTVSIYSLETAPSSQNDNSV